MGVEQNWRPRARGTIHRLALPGKQRALACAASGNPNTCGAFAAARAVYLTRAWHVLEQPAMRVLVLDLASGPTAHLALAGRLGDTLKATTTVLVMTPHAGALDEIHREMDKRLAPHGLGHAGGNDALGSPRLAPSRNAERSPWYTNPSASPRANRRAGCAVATNASRSSCTASAANSW